MTTRDLLLSDVDGFFVAVGAEVVRVGTGAMENGIGTEVDEEAGAKVVTGAIGTGAEVVTGVIGTGAGVVSAGVVTGAVVTGAGDVTVAEFGEEEGAFVTPTGAFVTPTGASGPPPVTGAAGTAAAT